MPARRYHLWLGCLAGPFLVVLAVTGVLLAVDALWARATQPAAAPASLSVAELAAGLAGHGTLERLAVTPVGTIVAQFAAPRRRAAVDPTDLSLRPVAETGDTIRTATEIHRTLMIGDRGRLILALATCAGLLLAATGLARIWRGERGGGALRRLHRGLGLTFALPFVVSAATGLGLAVATIFPLQIDGIRPAFPAAFAEGDRLPVGAVAALASVAVGDLEELVLPRADDANDGYFLATADRFAWIDPVSGGVAAASERPVMHRLAAAVLRFHAGRSMTALAVIFGLAAAAVGLLGLTGLAVGGIAIAIRRRRPVVSGAAAKADTIILVGSQGGTTWGFAERLAARLIEAGHLVDLAAMNNLASEYPKAQQLIVLTATHGIGEPPDSADRFLARLPQATLPPAFAVLGFGDREAKAFCGFAEAVDAALLATGAKPMLSLERIHRRSETDYAAWVERLLAALGHGRQASLPTDASTARQWPAPVVRGSPTRRVLSGTAMGSRWSVQLWLPQDHDLSDLTARLSARIARIETSLSRFRGDSEVMAFDRAPCDVWQSVSRDLAEVLAVGLDIGRRSGGAFDVGLAAEVAACGFGSGWSGSGVARDRIVAAHETIELDRGARRIRKRAAVSLDLAGIAKGWAVDELSRLVAEAGFPAHLVALDGELRAGAVQPDGRPWAIGLEAPAVGRRAVIGHIDLIKRSVATSGNNRRFAANGGHTLDPATGRSVAAGPASVSVFASTCIVADAWATALMVRGRDGLAAARAAGVEALFVAREPLAMPPATRAARWLGAQLSNHRRCRDAQP
ncbi:FAD:protein FMN transferase [Rhodopseudomonas palustris]|uniref:FAD:protein FMN transferase n=1 Tax=Rhodopseudomonas palustris (strain BisB18) TaxID=316056 RepID=Q21BK4_RHOPB